jgi:hypothetical protein
MPTPPEAAGGESTQLARAPSSAIPSASSVVYLKMLLVGFFEDLPRERAIANCCAGRSVRAFLDYSLTPDRSTLGAIRERMSLRHIAAVHRALLTVLDGTTCSKRASRVERRNRGSQRHFRYLRTP